MDAFAFHPYPESSSTGPNFPHPNGTSIGLADYPKLVALLGTAFDGTAQHGSSLPILYDEFGIETTVPAAKAPLYTGTEPATTHPVDDATQAQMYTQAMQMAFCQKTVMGLFLFHVQDEAAIAAWQSGEYYVDGTPKSSLPAIAAAAATRAPRRRRVVPGPAVDAEARRQGVEADESGYEGQAHVFPRLQLHRFARSTAPHRHRPSAASRPRSPSKARCRRAGTSSPRAPRPS